MNKAQNTNAGTAPLGGIMITLRRLYSPRFDGDAAIAAAIDAIARNERARLAARDTVRPMSRVHA